MKTAMKKPGPVPEVSWPTFVGLLDLMDSLIHKWGSDVESVCCADLATFIWNQGELEDQAEALVALYPIAKSLFERLEARRRKLNKPGSVSQVDHG